MPCLLGCLAMVTPRLVLLVVWLSSNYLEHAYHTKLWPVLGFLFMPLTTLAYAWAMNAYGSVQGLGLVVVVIAVLADLGLIGGGSRSAARRRRAARED